jgi:hypothetical protein
MFTWENLVSMRSGIETFNQQKYWECHEELEHVWLEERTDPCRYVYWAVIQVAAMMVHYRDKKIIGCVGMLTKARDKFKKCRELSVVNETVLEHLSWLELERLVNEIPEQPELTHFQKIFEFRFVNYPFDKITT